MLEETLESPLDNKEIKPLSPKGNQLNIHWKEKEFKLLQKIKVVCRRMKVLRGSFEMGHHRLQAPFDQLLGCAIVVLSCSVVPDSL